MSLENCFKTFRLPVSPRFKLHYGADNGRPRNRSKTQSKQMRLTSQGWISIARDEDISQYTAVVKLARLYRRYFQTWINMKCSVTLPIPESTVVEDNRFEYIHLKQYQQESPYDRAFPLGEVDNIPESLRDYELPAARYVEQQVLRRHS